jgi:hypothetical protein
MAASLSTASCEEEMQKEEGVGLLLAGRMRRAI